MNDAVSPGLPEDEAGEVRLEEVEADLLSLVPRSARSVLHLGCGEGRLGTAIRHRQSARVVGVTTDEQSAQTARARIDEVVVVEGIAAGLSAVTDTFDCIVLDDLSLCARDPSTFLMRVRALLSPVGCLIASFANARHHARVTGLLAGDWQDVPSRDTRIDLQHFFTRRDIEKLLYQCEFEAATIRVHPGLGYRDWLAAGCPQQVTIGPLQVNGSGAADIEGFFADRYTLRALPAPQADYGLTSIVVPAWNQLDFTKACLDSIRRYTPEPYEIIVVDNGSTDGTGDYLRAAPDIDAILNEENRGFPAAVNQGMNAAKGRQVLLLNNDVVVTTGWLRRMLAVLHSDATVGLVGPCSNNVSGPQQIPISYQALAGLEAFAWEHGKLAAGQRSEVTRLVGFCFLVKREVIEAIGLLDEQFGIGMFEDDDYCRRALAAGFRAVIAGDAFVHHFGSQTFASSGIDPYALYQENLEKFANKWTTEAEPAPSVKSPDKPPRADTPGQAAGDDEAAEEPTFTLRPRRPGGISLCMIARDEETNIRECLESIKPHVDEMIVVDTGSKDRTIEIARQCGARVETFPWCDDFSAARNESLKYAQYPWIFWMDADDRIPLECGKSLRELTQQAKADVFGFTVQVRCLPREAHDGGFEAVDHVKLIRNDPRLRFEFHIHEQILPSIRGVGGEVVHTDLYVVHAGYDTTEEGQARKRERDERLLLLDLKDHPQHPFVLFNAGMTAYHTGDPERAIPLLEDSIQFSGPTDSQLRKAYALLCGAYRRTGREQEAVQVCDRGLQCCPDDPELLFNRGLCLHSLGRLQEAVSSYKQILEGGATRAQLGSVDTGILGFKSRHNLGAIYLDMGLPSEAEEQFRLAVTESPEFLDAWLVLVELLARRGEVATAQSLIAEKLADERLRLQRLASSAKLSFELERYDHAAELLREAVSIAPGNAPLWRLLSHCLLRLEAKVEAAAALEALADVAPDDAEARHNLGTVRLELGKHHEAVAALQVALDLRPNYAPTHRHLAAAYEGLGQKRLAQEHAQRAQVLEGAVRNG